MVPEGLHGGVISVAWVWEVQCFALWDRPCRALPKGQWWPRVSGFGSLVACTSPSRVCVGVIVLVLVRSMCAGRRVDTLVVCMCGLGDRAGTHSRGVASAVFPNLFIPPDTCM